MSTIRTLAVTTLRALALYHPLHDLRRDFRFRSRMRKELKAWQAKGRPVPPPAVVKHRCLREYAERYGTSVLIETGTFYGDTPFALRNVFREIHSIELSPSLHELVTRELSHLQHVHLHLGDSAELLPQVVGGIAAPTLFWLDGHYCSGPSALGSKQTPIEAELAWILDRPAGSNVILIDDARFFVGTDDYPRIESLAALVSARRPQAVFLVEDDIIRIAPV
jgi:hypothetical protein